MKGSRKEKCKGKQTVTMDIRHNLLARKCIHTSTVHFFSAKNSKVIKSIAQLIANTEML